MEKKEKKGQSPTTLKQRGTDPKFRNSKKFDYCQIKMANEVVF